MRSVRLRITSCGTERGPPSKSSTPASSARLPLGSWVSFPASEEGVEEAPVPAYIYSYDFSELYLMKDPKEFNKKIQLALAEAKKARQAADGG